MENGHLSFIYLVLFISYCISRCDHLFLLSIFQQAIYSMLISGTDSLDVPTMPAQVLMSTPFSSLGSLLELFRVGVATNWWGLGCPSHCGHSSFPALIFSFLAGLGLGLFLGVLTLLSLAFRFGILPVPPCLSSAHLSSSRPARAGAAPESTRLRAYLNE